ncbi:site-specific integrase [Psychrobacillus sp. MER TA 171]|uniref:site-specific integrase n=1 Tax=Psychrobacillus sp. MER TA 171 TaxID=2939577 RepID=UPI00203E4690|nr:site-specific integrase [Psychrobacillus sp. MER TA 171]MCM3359363.1 site-specific integrase [Psychrobacillus sp. MER TA 171]
MANIVKRGGNSYRFTVYQQKDAKGRYPRKTKTHTVTKKMTPKQLKEHLEHEFLKFKQEVLSGDYINPEKMPFSEFVEEWFEKFAEKELSSTTLANHVFKLNNHILPVIGHIPLDKINSMVLLDLLSNLTRKDGKEGELSLLSKQDIYRTLQSIFKYSTQWKVISNNPMEGVNKPKNNQEVKREVNVYEEEEVTAILQALQDEPFPWRMFLTLSITAGIRRGENLGLEWSKVDFENNRIDITQSIVIGKNGPLIKSPKSLASKRLVTLPPSVMKELKQYRKYWVAEKLKSKTWKEEEREWLFCQKDGSHLYPSSPSNWWSKFSKRTKFRYIRLHDLRHTSASLLIAQGVHAKIIAKRLGHSHISITMDTYGHALRTADQAAADTLEGLFQPKDIQTK